MSFLLLTSHELGTVVQQAHVPAASSMTGAEKMVFLLGPTLRYMQSGVGTPSINQLGISSTTT
jgi:hypothetical protein